MTDQQEQDRERAVRIFQRVSDATRAIIVEELGDKDTLPAAVLLMGAAAAAGSVIDMVEVGSGGKMPKAAGLGLLIQYLVGGLEENIPVGRADN